MAGDENYIEDVNKSTELTLHSSKNKLFTPRSVSFITLIFIASSFLWLYGVYTGGAVNANYYGKDVVMTTAFPTLQNNKILNDSNNNNNLENSNSIKYGNNIGNDKTANTKDYYTIDNKYNNNRTSVEGHKEYENLSITTNTTVELIVRNIETESKEIREQEGNEIFSEKVNANKNNKQNTKKLNEFAYANNMPWMKQVIKENMIKQSSKNIFFIETSCGTEKLRKNRQSSEGLILNARQACAVESTANMNPDYNVYLFHTCKVINNFHELSPIYVRELFSYPNFFVVQVNMDNFFKVTPLQDMWDKIEGSSYPLEHMSDAMRLVVLWRYGGTYLDLDVVSIRPLSKLESNFAGVQDDSTINGAILNFLPNGFAHDILTTCLESFRNKFDGSQWATNGPLLITDALLEICHVSLVTETTKSDCGGFHVYPSDVFYAVHFSDWKSFFDENEKDRVLKKIENSTIVHLWNYMSHGSNLFVAHGSAQPYSILAKKYCHKVYTNLATDFR